MARKLRMVALDPARYLTRLRSVEAFKVRVGDYRAIVDVDWQQRIVYVLSVGHRSTVYRRRAEAPRVAVAHRADRLSCRKAISSRLRLRFTVAVSATRACRFAPGLVGFRSSCNIDRLRLGELRKRDSIGLEDR